MVICPIREIARILCIVIIKINTPKTTHKVQLANSDFSLPDALKVFNSMLNKKTILIHCNNLND